MPDKIALLRKLHQSQNDTAREAETFLARQIQDDRGCGWAEALKSACRILGQR